MAIFSKRSLEGEFLIDHKNSPGITPEYVMKSGVKNAQNVVVVGAGQRYESAIMTCHGCTGDIVINPKRTRERAWCMKHDAYLCDNCEERRRVSGECIPFNQHMEQLWHKLNKRSH